jgi:selenocysteine lyase/cysteine desulfurase
LGVIPFNLEGRPVGLVAAVLGHESGIAVRSGCFCAQPYVSHLLGVPLVNGSPEAWAPRSRG